MVATIPNPSGCAGICYTGISARRFGHKSQVALVTGSTCGIGLEVAKRLAGEGATVVLNSRNQSALSAIIESTLAEHDGIDGELFDVGDEDQVAAGFQNIIDRHGRLDILVNNAGILLDKTIFDTALGEWDSVIRSNLTGAFLCSKAAMGHFRDRDDGGRIIMIGSVAGQRGAPAGVVAYSASKAGLIGLAQTLAFTGAPYGVTANVVSPDMIETDMLRQGFGSKIAEAAQRVPLGLGRPVDVAEAVLFLASEAGRYITGATLDVNGGLYHR